MLRQHAGVFAALFAVITLLFTSGSHALAEETTPASPIVVTPQIHTVSPTTVSLGGIIDVTIDGLAQRLFKTR